jgi:nuclear pore complex protein Nup160
VHSEAIGTSNSQSLDEATMHERVLLREICFLMESGCSRECFERDATRAALDFVSRAAMSASQAQVHGPGQILVSTHISSLWSSSRATVHAVPTSRLHTPPLGPSNESAIPAEHASCSSLFNSPETGKILLRLIHHGLILELVSLSTSTNPIRFVFPATVLPNPAVVLWQSTELHILAVTTYGSLYRITLPVRGRESPTLWREHVGPNWCREYHIRHAPLEKLYGIVQVLGADSLAVILHTGQMIRLYAEVIGGDSTNGAP